MPARDKVRSDLYHPEDQRSEMFNQPWSNASNPIGAILADNLEAAHAAPGGLALRDAISIIRQAQPGLVAKQVHAELMKDGRFDDVTVSEVKKTCSKLAKAEIRGGGPSGVGQFALATNDRERANVARDLLQDPQTRNAQAFKMNRPGLPTNGTTLTKGDRLGTAAERGDTQQVVKLLKKGVDPDFKNAASGVTPLGVACERGHIGVVKALIDARASAESATAEGYRPLHISSQFGKTEVVELLCTRAGADVHARCPLQDTFPLSLAANFDHADTIRVLLREKADPNFKSVDRQVGALHYCFSAETVELLLHARAAMNESDNPEKTSPLHSLCAAGSAEGVAALLLGGADPTARDGDDLTPLELAMETGGSSSNMCASVIIAFVKACEAAACSLARRAGIDLNKFGGTSDERSLMLTKLLTVGNHVEDLKTELQAIAANGGRSIKSTPKLLTEGTEGTEGGGGSGSGADDGAGASSATPAYAAAALDLPASSASTFLPPYLRPPPGSGDSDGLGLGESEAAVEELLGEANIGDIVGMDAQAVAEARAAMRVAKRDGRIPGGPPHDEIDTLSCAIGRRLNFPSADEVNERYWTEEARARRRDMLTLLLQSANDNPATETLQELIEKVASDDDLPQWCLPLGATAANSNEGPSRRALLPPAGDDEGEGEGLEGVYSDDDFDADAPSTAGYMGC